MGLVNIYNRKIILALRLPQIYSIQCWKIEKILSRLSPGWWQEQVNTKQYNLFLPESYLNIFRISSIEMNYGKSNFLSSSFGERTIWYFCLRSWTRDRQTVCWLMKGMLECRNWVSTTLDRHKYARMILKNNINFNKFTIPNNIYHNMMFDVLISQISRISVVKLNSGIQKVLLVNKWFPSMYIAVGLDFWTCVFIVSFII